MKFVIVLACFTVLAVSAAVAEEKNLSEVDASNKLVEVSASDQDTAEWYGRGYYGAYRPYGHYYNPYGYSGYRGHSGYNKHWRGRRSAITSDDEDQQAEADSSWGYRRGYYRGYPSYHPYSSHYYSRRYPSYYYY